MPPRIRSRLESGTADHLAGAIDDDDLDGHIAIEHGKRLLASAGGDGIAQRQPRGLRKPQDLAGGVGTARRLWPLRRRG